MREVRKYGVHIDYCPVCRGIWLDRGEVDKIVLSAPAAAVSEETAGENIVAGNGERGYELNRILSFEKKGALANLTRTKKPKHLCDIWGSSHHQKSKIG
jgi:hypothetical protein